MALETMNVSLPSMLKRFVERRVAEGGYGNTSEYVRELIRRDQERTASTMNPLEINRRHDALEIQSSEHLAELIEEGFASGRAVELTKDDWNHLYQEVERISVSSTSQE